MVGSSWSSSSSCTSSFGSLDDDIICIVKQHARPEGSVVKFLCSYGGRILPRHTDGALRYVGGDNRVLSVDRSLHLYELQRKLREMCGGEDVSLRCQLPTEDLDALVSVTSDDDLANLLDEYDAANRDRLQPLKIRAFLFPTSPQSTSSRPSPNAHLRRQTGSPTCAPRGRWCAAPQTSSLPAAPPIAQQQPQSRPHNGCHWQ